MGFYDLPPVINIDDGYFDVVAWLEQEMERAGYQQQLTRIRLMPDTNPVLPTVDLTTLDIDQLNDYRHDLTLAIRNPGTDFDDWDEAQKKVYLDQIKAIKEQLETLGYTG